MKIILIYDLEENDIFYYIPDFDSPEPFFIEPRIEKEEGQDDEEPIVH